MPKVLGVRFWIDTPSVFFYFGPYGYGYIRGEGGGGVKTPIYIYTCIHIKQASQSVSWSCEYMISFF